MFAFAPSHFLGSFQSQRAATLPSVAPRSRSHGPSMSEKVLIVNTKSGGHAFIGLHLARSLLDGGNSVDILQVGPESQKGPFGKYTQLATEHPGKFSVRYGDVTDESVGTGYTAVYDNNAKKVEDIEPVIKAGKAGAEVFYVSSAGSYSYNPNVFPHIPGDAAKGGVIDVENALVDSGVSSVNFRPIYIIGSESAKRDYLDYFFHRIVRGRPVLLPGTGSEMTSLTDVRDVASMLTAVLGKGMKNELVNIVNTRCISFDGVVKLCEAVCGKEAKVVYYDPVVAAERIDGFNVKKAFPFRPRHFFADPGEAQEKLGWSAEYSGSKEGLENAIKLSFQDFISLGLDKSEVDFSTDDAILNLLA